MITYDTAPAAPSPLSGDWPPWQDCGCPQGVAAIASDPARFGYLFDPSLPARPPTEAEAAKYPAIRAGILAARSQPLITAPSSLPVAGDLEPVSVPAAEPLEPLPADPAEAAADAAQKASDERLAQWAPRASTETVPAVPAAEGEAGHE